MNIALRVYSARWKVFEREWRERQLCRNVYSKLAKRVYQSRFIQHKKGSHNLENREQSNGTGTCRSVNININE